MKCIFSCMYPLVFILAAAVIWGGSRIEPSCWFYCVFFALFAQLKASNIAWLHGININLSFLSLIALFEKSLFPHLSLKQQQQHATLNFPYRSEEQTKGQTDGSTYTYSLRSTVSSLFKSVLAISGYMR